MPRRQRFKPSRKPKPAVELTDAEKDVMIPVSKPLEPPVPTTSVADESRDETVSH